MKDKLIVYAYNVLFGDAILVEVPDGNIRRFILIDVGNSLTGRGGTDQALVDSLKDIHTRTNGKIDLYIMTHEHMDHIQGLLLASENNIKFEVDTVWMTASSEDGYYDRHKEAREKKLELQKAVVAFFNIRGVSQLTDEYKMLLDMTSRKTKDCLDFIRKLSPKKTYYVHRTYDIRGKHPFKNVEFRILAPEEDTQVYYQSVPHFALAEETSAAKSSRSKPIPLPGVDGGAFFDLIERMDSTLSESMFAIDQAGNNTSIVFELNWRGKRLLFTGDAEQKSWAIMVYNKDLKSVDFDKIAHHGSRTASPSPDALGKILPMGRRQQAVAVLSTFPALESEEKQVHSGVPDKATVDLIKKRTKKIYSTTDADPGKPVKITIT